MNNESEDNKEENLVEINNYCEECKKRRKRISKLNFNWL